MNTTPYVYMYVYFLGVQGKMSEHLREGLDLAGCHHYGPSWQKHIWMCKCLSVQCQEKIVSC